MVERIRELCKQRGTSITKLEQSLGFGNGVIGRWSKSKPSYDRIEKVANALDVSVSYIVGDTDQTEKPATVSGDELDETTREIMNILSDLTPEELALAKVRLLKIKESR